jgi:hypothetical protein
MVGAEGINSQRRREGCLAVDTFSIDTSGNNSDRMVGAEGTYQQQTDGKGAWLLIPSELTPEGNIPTWSVLKVSTANAEGKGAWLLIPSELTPQENTLSL